MTGSSEPQEYLTELHLQTPAALTDSRSLDVLAEPETAPA